jgi:hypothetical protein
VGEMKNTHNILVGILEGTRLFRRSRPVLLHGEYVK